MQIVELHFAAEPKCDFIESGNTVAGIGEGSRWACQFENALVPPERDVLDVNPGPMPQLVADNAK